MADQYDFRYENSINSTKKYLEIEGNVEHKYSAWRTNSVLSNYPDTIMQANQMNINPWLDEKLQYDYLFYSIRSRKRFYKRTKIAKNNDFALIQEYYKYNIERTKEILSLLTKEQINVIREKNNKGGIK